MDKREAPPQYSPPNQGGVHEMTNAQPAVQNPAVQNPPIVVNVSSTQPPGQGGTCPICHAGTFKSGFTLCGWLCCLFCFPCGIICCFCMRKKKCSHCGFSPS